MAEHDISQLKKEILGEIKRDTNGAVVGTMCEMNGGEVFFSYGVSVPKIKSIAKKHEGNHELAMELFTTKIRELKIAAVYIESAHCVTLPQMDQWQESFNSLEIAEHTCSILFYKSHYALQKGLEWIEFEDAFTSKAGYFMLSRRAKVMFNEDESEYYLRAFEKAIEAVKCSKNRHTVRGAEVFLISVSCAMSDLKNRLEDIASRGGLGDSTEDILWHINE